MARTRYPGRRLPKHLRIFDLVAMSFPKADIASFNTPSWNKELCALNQPFK